jgi:hypothetical protein
MFVATKPVTLAKITLTSSCEHVSALAFNLGGEVIGMEEEGDRTMLTFAFEDYYKAVIFQSSLGHVRGFISALVGKNYAATPDCLIVQD